MDSEAILSRLTNNEPVSVSEPVDGLGQAYFSKLLHLYGGEVAGLESLGKKWRRVLRMAADSAWVYRAGGVYERSRGKWRASAAAFISAGDHATEPVTRYAFQVGAIDSLARAGKVADAELLARRIAVSLRRLGESGLAARAMLNLGNSLVYQDRMTEARRVLQSAIPDLELSGFVQEAVSGKMALSSTYLFGGDPRLAETLAREVESAAKEHGLEYLANLARLNVALSMILTGRSEEAHRILIELRSALADSVADSVRVEEYLGDSYSRLNLWDEAYDSYHEAFVIGSPIPLHRANLELGMGEALTAMGRLDDARLHLERARRGYRNLNNEPWQAVCLHRIARLDLVAGNRALAIRRLASAESLAANSPFHLSEIWLTQTEVGVDRLARAKALISRYGYLDLAWKVHWLRAISSQRPLPHFRKMFDSIATSRLGRRSAAARMRFMEDKTRAMQAYLGYLLSKPTGANVREAVQVIERARSVTLIDEILTAGTYPQELTDSLARIRSQIGQLLDEPPSGQTRFGVRRGVRISQAQRTATEGLMALRLISGDPKSHAESGVILAELDSEFGILSGGKVFWPTVSGSQLADLVRWMPFELLAPMADPKVLVGSAIQILQDIAGAFAPVWKSKAASICPDGLAWRIPWSACSILADYPSEWALSLHPAMNCRFQGKLDRESKAVVWLGKSDDLKHARVEAESVAGKFDNCPIVNTRAEAERSLNGKYDAIHIVSHAVHRSQNPALSTIEFPDGPVFSHEIARSRLNVRLATLSACETGSLSIASRSEPDGLARAFLARGAQSVVASQWPLDDESAYRQFNLFFDALIAGYPITKALHGARLACREWRDHPYYWGALALYAGYEK